MGRVEDKIQDTIYAEHKHEKELRRKYKKYDPRSWNMYQTARRRSRARVLDAPHIFSIIKNTDDVVSYFDSVRFAQESREFIVVNLASIDYIDLATVSLLMAHMFDARLPRGYLTVTAPHNEQPKELFKRVEFHKTVTSGNSNSAHFLSRQGHNQEHKMAVLKRVASFSGNEKDTDLNPLLTEILSNTNNHASVRSKGVVPWLITLEEDSVNKVIKFCVTDLGIGIYDRLVFTNNAIKKINLPRWLVAFFESSQNKTLAKNIPAGLISSTKLFYRGQGMRNIHKIVSEGSFRDFHVITNKAHLNMLLLDEKKADALLNFRGTLYYWSIEYEQ